jgi:hypothetical protein
MENNAMGDRVEDVQAWNFLVLFFAPIKPKLDAFDLNVINFDFILDMPQQNSRRGAEIL